MTRPNLKVTLLGETVNYKPEVTLQNFVAKITSNTVILAKPICPFGNLTNLTCTPDVCEIWLVPALNSAASTFDADKTDPTILTLSPYPTAFNNGSKNYFLTKVGIQKDVNCSSSPSNQYFRVGAEGDCSTANCNGVLPVGSTVKFKYLLVEPTNKTVLADTEWSDNITLYTLKDPNGINTGLPARSGAMVVITTILSVAMAILLLFLLILLILTLCYSRSEPISVGSLRVPRYDTHNVKGTTPYVNPTYESDGNKYATSDTLPRASIDPDVLKLQDM
ncbi:uroplakin-3b [Chanos chanos]|uniref:Uroplakin-3b n=1 Tax=Chanos chanos TaxID=29144 RepID=A0A6J2WWZ7_CHACN|nr:uroplakin-3b-like [Chanos chanos]